MNSSPTPRTPDWRRPWQVPIIWVILAEVLFSLIQANSWPKFLLYVPVIMAAVALVLAMVQLRRNHWSFSIITIVISGIFLASNSYLFLPNNQMEVPGALPERVEGSQLEEQQHAYYVKGLQVIANITYVAQAHAIPAGSLCIINTVSDVGSYYRGLDCTVGTQKLQVSVPLAFLYDSMAATMDDNKHPGLPTHMVLGRIKQDMIRFLSTDLGFPIYGDAQMLRRGTVVQVLDALVDGSTVCFNIVAPGTNQVCVPPDNIEIFQGQSR